MNNVRVVDISWLGNDKKQHYNVKKTDINTKQGSNGGKEFKKTEDMQKRNTKMAYVNPIISVIALNVND